MTPTDLPPVCRSASLALQLPDAEALGRGDTVWVDGVPVELHATGGVAAVVLVVGIGAPPEARALEVYRQLLQLQLLSADQPGLRFGFDPFRGSVVLTQALPFGPAFTAEALVAVVRACVAQALQWRDTLLQPPAAEGLDAAAGRMPPLGPHAVHA